MSMSLPSGGDEDEINSTINTTPLVDIMLVLLIIFLITIPVVIKSVQLQLPVATKRGRHFRASGLWCGGYVAG